LNENKPSNDHEKRIYSSEIIPGHPVHTYIQENRAIKALLIQFRNILELIKNQQDPNLLLELRAKFNLLLDIKKHYQREEELLFPLLKDNDGEQAIETLRLNILEIEERLERIDNLFKKEIIIPNNIEQAIQPVIQRISSVIKKEETVIYPLSIQKLSEDDWIRIALQSDSFGYCIVVPEKKWQKTLNNFPNREKEYSQLINFTTGRISSWVFEKFMEHVPMQLSFIDDQDKFIYFSPTREQIFSRTQANLGRDISHCHPPKSLNHVYQILNDFKNNKRDSEVFWINFQDRFIFFEYHAIRNDNGDYIGTLERIQDITSLRSLQGEKRLMSNLQIRSKD
jgi:DUF438 domain-containing protein